MYVVFFSFRLCFNLSLVCINVHVLLAENGRQCYCQTIFQYQSEWINSFCVVVGQEQFNKSLIK